MRLLHLTNTKVRICMYPDHNPPHLHLIGPDWSAKIDLRTLVVTQGTPPRSELAEAIKLAAEEREYLEAWWTNLRRVRYPDEK